MHTGKKQPPMLSARLPDNYSPDRKFPLFIYLIGGPGERGEVRNLAPGIGVIGKKDYLCVSLPLFKKVWDINGPAKGLFVLPDDYETISNCYRVMLRKLFDTVPNITRDGSVFGGHSNGAHTTGVLLAGRDNFILDHFEDFYFHEGGIMSLTPEVLAREEFKNRRFLVMMGERAWDAKPKDGEKRVPMIQALRDATAANQLDFTYITMVGYGHEQPQEYLNLMGQWARREPIEDIPAKLKSLSESLALPLTTHPDSSNWPDLLNSDLSNCKFPGVTWNLADGILTTSRDAHLWTKNTYGVAVLDLEYQGEPGALGGVYLYNSDPENQPSASVGIQLGGHSSSGSFIGHQPAEKSTSKPEGEWNKLTITCRGAEISVLLNGEIANRIDLSRWTSAGTNPDGTAVPHPLQGKPWAELPREGRIGLRGKGFAFRNIKVLKLQSPVHP